MVELRFPKSEYESFFKKSGKQVLLSIRNVNSVHIQRGDELLALAEKDTEHRELFSGCASILYASALEEETTSALRILESQLKLDESVEAYHRLGRALRECLFNKVMILPEFMSEGRFRVARKSFYGAALEELIAFRNGLLHIAQPPTCVHVSPDELEYQGDQIVINVDLLLPRNYWGEIRPEKVRAFRDATKCYVKEIYTNGPHQVLEPVT